ncbi:hypothetical protein HDC94_001454 [Leifsonia sp. AK011]|uniref:hypothetical protein n=1 Tax=Leifsonia sp. AK011 TaxID=2723075 RepID=UPI0015CC8E45|nr:hypothetical protein [Leifsonia sp. AK011]NYF10298.1 hypothetical protein [Leifsonia sp. AK011]
MTSLPEENTLGTVIGRPFRRRESDATRRVIRAATPRRSSLGTGFIGIGAAVVVGLRAVYGFVWFVGLWSVYPIPYAALAAWTVLIVTLVATFVTIRVLGELPTWAFALFLLGLAASVGLDLFAIWDLHDIGHFATAAPTAVMGLLVALTSRRTSDIVVAASVFGAGLATAMIVNTAWSENTASAQVTTLAFAVLPAIIGAVVISGFRRLVQVELDRVLVQSTVSAPRFAVGMLASEELARLDLAAEELLDSVATGKVKLPLHPKTASVAASLATELRLHLIEGRRETWLYHAITESDLLGKAVTLTDKGNLAGLLDPQQRDGLLSTAWLLIADNSVKASSPRTVHLTLGPATSAIDTPSGKIWVPIVITTTGVPRNRVDPATWEAIGRVGQHSDSTENQSLRVDISALVDNPADQ